MARPAMKGAHLFEFAGRRVLLTAPAIEELDLARIERRFYATRAPHRQGGDDVPRFHLRIEEGLAPRYRRQALAQALVRAFASTRLIPLHAAGLVAPSGAPGLLVLGAASSGKTTLVTSLLEVGWRVASDDALMIEPATLQCRAFRRTIEPQIGWRRDGSRKKRAWDPAAQVPDRFVAQFFPRALVFLGHRGTATTLAPLPKAAAFVRLLGATEGRDAEAMATLRSLTACGPALLALCGPDVLSAPQVVSDLLLSALDGSCGAEGVAA